ncbi:terminase [Rhodobacter sphaeroides]|jgi:Phage terminase-like protein, large subunit|uniref:Phage terminase-like protein, large subunit n=1 Tax=Cereibacter sphaeroides (strain ATCC 17023 / DSM 158 / JCM 6121 / CCUG 31486 / LMG 2827 / NBRC 12203 / NCIMB 8253 / ATH 2.4.1.) TaxID=272943 RepID=Q3J220_CERS4|nr:terminase TerL endonuclease subunit [Cereibacter sphaeroides]ABA79164.2 phage terminase-like protein, large subunit [Cereibacter sphaeroides 2.4.1]ANS34184.1 terminase [Cereibacter sphaeroides]ATN63229.1 terminase [Cereibacter sphaeroides]AXC61375.1 terminase [Cereibacter sphaeroides 2.4.1]MVX47662.1 terminase [Cereibacter sphaeroides]
MSDQSLPVLSSAQPVIPPKPKLSRAEKNIKWIESNLFIPEGKDVGKPFRLVDFQKDIIRSIYDNPAGTRRAIISMPRKAAKTTLCAALMLLHLVGREALPNSQLYSAARSRDQAAELFKLAVKMIRMSPRISRFVRIVETSKRLKVPELGTEYRALSKDAGTAQGLSPCLVIHDELGQVRGPVDPLYEALELATAAQANPLTLVISTQAPTDNDLLSQLIDDAATGADPTKVLKLYSCPMNIDPFSEEALAVSHPAWNSFVNRKELKQMQAEAARMPARAADFRNYTLNQRIEVNAPFISKDVWDEGKDNPEEWHGKDVWLGLDLSETRDLTSLTLAHKDENGLLHVHPFFWLPDEGIEDKSRSDKVPYDIWAKGGLIHLSQGRTIQYKDVAAKLKEIADNANVQKVAFDRYKIKYFKRDMIDCGFDERWIDEHMVSYGQGFVSMGIGINELERLILDGKIRHGNNPVMNMCMANVKVVSDTSNNRKFIKHTSTRRIDGAVTLAMLAGMLADPDNKPKPKRKALFA